MFKRTNHFFQSRLQSSHAFEPFVAQVNLRAESLKLMPQKALDQELYDVRSLLYAQGLNEHLLVKAFALIKIHCHQTLGLNPYDTQLMAARIMLEGRLAEMATGEGKTLASGIAAACAAMSGRPVHLITANDYLAARDAEYIQPLIEVLGMTVGTVVAGMERPARKVAYACHVTYCTAKEVAFDYLRDELASKHIQSALHLQVAQLSSEAPDTVLRELSYALIDEADSVLIDEAATPLILSSQQYNTEQMATYEQALSLAQALHLNQDFTLDEQEKRISFTDDGLVKLKGLSKHLAGIWRHDVYRQELVETAVSALHLYELNKAYLVDQDEVKIIDALTGRVAEGRVWSKGLHQMIAIKEKLPPAGELTTLAQITFQNFFQHYQLIGGMSGTVKEAKAELYDVYGLKIHVVPLHKPNKMQIWPSVAFKDQKTMHHHLLQQVIQVHALGRPILVGTDSVADSEALSTLLTESQLPHQVLNARQNALEASIIKSAGQRDKITIATNIAGRGTDIHINQEVTNLGGLHVVSCQHNQARRVDRQLIGRSARQGKPGSAQVFFNVNQFGLYQNTLRFIHTLIPNKGLFKPQSIIFHIFSLPKRLQEHQQRALRAALQAQDTEHKKRNLSV